VHHYHHRAFYFGVLSVVLIGGGLLALNFPVFIDTYDHFGFQIKCGTGFHTNLTQAAEAGGGAHVDQCETALLVRRLWAIPTSVIGAVLLGTITFVAATLWGRESVFGSDSRA
jgi:hypothetical protein